MTLTKHTGEKRVPILYLDLDGTVRWGKDELGRFVNGPEDVRVFDEVPALLARYKEHGWRIVGVTNQGGVALGHMTQDQCIAAVAETQRQSGHAFDKITVCVHHPLSADPEAAVCWCRKPRAGMLIESSLVLQIEHTDEIYPPYMALMVGDRPEDAQAAEAANVPFLAADVWRAGQHVPRRAR